jgi:hypothetical protein
MKLKPSTLPKSSCINFAFQIMQSHHTRTPLLVASKVKRSGLKNRNEEDQEIDEDVSLLQPFFGAAKTKTKITKSDKLSTESTETVSSSSTTSCYSSQGSSKSTYAAEREGTGTGLKHKRVPYSSSLESSSSATAPKKVKSDLLSIQECRMNLASENSSSVQNSTESRPKTFIFTKKPEYISSNEPQPGTSQDARGHGSGSVSAKPSETDSGWIRPSVNQKLSKLTACDVSPIQKVLDQTITISDDDDDVSGFGFANTSPLYEQELDVIDFIRARARCYRLYTSKSSILLTSISK